MAKKLKLVIPNQRLFRVSFVGYEEREDETPFLQTTVVASHHKAAIPIAIREIRKRWPTLALPKEAEVEVVKLTDAFGRDLSGQRVYSGVWESEAGEA